MYKIIWDVTTVEEYDKKLELILSLPKSIAIKYINHHFDKFGVNEFYKIVDRVPIRLENFRCNRELNENSNVLNYMLKKDGTAFRYFAPCAMTEENIETIANQKNDLNLNDMYNFPQLLKNSKIWLKFDCDIRPFLSLVSDLYDYINVYVDENDQEQQAKYYTYLDLFVDAIASLRYREDKENFLYTDIVSLNKSILSTFDSAYVAGDTLIISQYIEQLYNFCGGLIPKNVIEEEVNRYYAIYLENNVIDLSLTKDFCNMVLNQHRNNYIRITKEEILAEVQKNLELTETRKNLILMSRKIRKVEKFIRHGDYASLGITVEEYEDLFDNVKTLILNNKDIMKSGISLSEIKLLGLFEIFNTHGFLSSQIVAKYLQCTENEYTDFIARKFEQVKFHLAQNITLTKDEKEISTTDKLKQEGITPTNFIIANSKLTANNISDILRSINSEENYKKVLWNERFIKDFTFLIPFVNLLDELDTNTMINILLYSEKIMYKLFKGNDELSPKTKAYLILKHLDKVISLAKEYASLDDLSKYVIGQQNAKLLEDDVSAYLDVYHNMLTRKACSIPPIKLEIDNLFYEAGKYGDFDRLLIGKIPYADSCITPTNYAGKATFYEVLFGENADVILVKNNEGQMVSRIFAFRRGNVVQLVGSANKPIRGEVYKEIADEIIKKAIDNDDNIDYVFVSTFSVYAGADFPRVHDICFEREFPHADTGYAAYLLSSKELLGGEIASPLKLKLTDLPKGKYIGTRSNINYSPPEFEITRLRALDIVMDENIDSRERKEHLFEPFSMSDYESVVCGQDWYIAVKKDKTIEEVILPTNDNRIYEEMAIAKEKLQLSYDDNSMEDSFIHCTKR